MIAALALCAALVAADRPFVVTWSVNWGKNLNPTTHSARFADPEEALAVYAKVPMCSPEKQPPCVIWARVNYSPLSGDKQTSNK